MLVRLNSMLENTFNILQQVIACLLSFQLLLICYFAHDHFYVIGMVVINVNLMRGEQNSYIWCISVSDSKRSLRIEWACILFL